MKSSKMAAEFFPKIDYDKCLGCELCVKNCPNHVLGFINELPIIIHAQACDYTGACQEICPTEAISLTYEIRF